MKAKITTQMLTRMALLIALNIILARFLSVRVPIGGAEGLRIGFGSLPVIFAGVFMGPLAGGIVGAVGDLIGYFINPIGGAYMPHFTMTAALRGIIPGLVMLLMARGRKEVGIFPLFLAVCLTLVTVEIFLIPYFIETLFGVFRAVLVPPRIIQNIITIPAYTILLFTLGRATERAFSPIPGRGALHLSGKLW
ncbi:MAG: folate family ECF transporter S component [Bacillota bacterium]